VDKVGQRLNARVKSRSETPLLLPRSSAPSEAGPEASYGPCDPFGLQAAARRDGGCRGPGRAGMPASAKEAQGWLRAARQQAR
jgi:hypothetical protein